MAAIVFEGVTKRFGDAVAVSDFSLEIDHGEFLVLVGPSGCGKSTTLRLLAGLEEVSDGKIYIADRLVNNVPPRDRDVAMVFQSYALYPHMSVFDNMAFGLKLRKVAKTEIARRVRETAAMLGIESLLTRKPAQLSGGQRQRVALGRAIVREPAAFLLDEPLSNLDAQLRVQTRADIRRLHLRLGTTFVYVTHDQVEAMTMASRIAVMKEGTLQQVGAPTELYQKPANLFVAGFIGSPAMNFFGGRIEQSGEQACFVTDSIRLPLPRSLGKALSNQDVIVGVRPEDMFDPHFPDAAAQAAKIDCQVELVEPLGSETYLHLTAGTHRFVARVDPETSARAGEGFKVCFDLGRLHIFDHDSGDRVTTTNRAT
jgi:multiple sugar transport system ATP-binding protein